MSVVTGESIVGVVSSIVDVASSIVVVFSVISVSKKKTVIDLMKLCLLRDLKFTLLYVVVSISTYI